MFDEWIPRLAKDGILSLAVGFLLALTRVGGALVFVPIPGLRAGSEIARIILAVSLTLTLFPRWNAGPAVELTISSVAASIAAECAFGILAGVSVALLLDVYQLAAQMIGLQAGFSYASTIDPTNDTDSGVFSILMQLLTALLFIGLGLDRNLILAFANSFNQIPLGSFVPTLTHAAELSKLASAIFSTGIRIAFPVIVLLVLLDVALALLSRIEQQVQLSGILFPVKNLAAFFLVASVIGAIPGLFSSTVRETLLSMGRLTTR